MYGPFLEIDSPMHSYMMQDVEITNLEADAALATEAKDKELSAFRMLQWGHLVTFLC